MVESGSLSKHLPDGSKPIGCINKMEVPIPSFLLFSTPLFIRTPSKSKLQASKPQLPANIALELHKSIASTVDRCLRLLREFASQNPLVHKLVSASSHLHSSFRVPHRIYRNPNILSSCNFAAILPGDSVAGTVVANGILNFLNIYNSLLVFRLVLTWFPNTPPAIVSPLSTLCDPYLNIFRGIIPPLGGTLDLSPILAFLVLNAFTSTAAALPAELPLKGSSPGIPSCTDVSPITTSQEKWIRRLGGSRSKSRERED